MRKCYCSERGPSEFDYSGRYASVGGPSHWSLQEVSDLVESDKDQSGFMYYLNDGIYGSFKSILFEGTGWVSYPKPLEVTIRLRYGSL